MTRDGTFLIEDGVDHEAVARRPFHRLGATNPRRHRGAHGGPATRQRCRPLRAALRRTGCSARRCARRDSASAAVQPEPPQGCLSSRIVLPTKSSAKKIVQRLRLRSTSEPPPSGPVPVPDAERPGEPGVLARVHQDQEHQDHADDDLHRREESLHAVSLIGNVVADKPTLLREGEEVDLRSAPRRILNSAMRRSNRGSFVACGGADWSRRSRADAPISASFSRLAAYVGGGGIMGVCPFRS